MVCVDSFCCAAWCDVYVVVCGVVMWCLVGLCCWFVLFVVWCCVVVLVLVCVAFVV